MDGYVWDFVDSFGGFFSEVLGSDLVDVDFEKQIYFISFKYLLPNSWRAREVF